VEGYLMPYAERFERVWYFSYLPETLGEFAKDEALGVGAGSSRRSSPCSSGSGEMGGRSWSCVSRGRRTLTPTLSSPGQRELRPSPPEGEREG